MRAFLCLAAFAAAMILSPPSGLAQGQTPGMNSGTGVSAAPLPVILDIRDANTPPTSARIPKPFVPGQKQASSKKKNKRPSKPKTVKPTPKQSAAIPPANAQDMPAPMPEAPKTDMGMEERPPLVTPPREKISPIVPYIDDAPPQGGDTGQGMDQTNVPADFKAATPDTSPELSPSPAPAQTPEAAPATTPEASPQASPEAAQTPQPAPGEIPQAPEAAKPETP